MRNLSFTIKLLKDIKTIIMITIFTGAPTTKIAHTIKSLGIKKVYEVSG